MGPMPNASLVHIFPMAPLGGGSGPPRGGSGLFIVMTFFILHIKIL